MKQGENLPKLVIVSDGQRTAAFFDGCFYGVGVARLEFVADAKSGTPTATFKLTDPNMEAFAAERSKELFWEMLQGLEKN